MLTVKVKNRQTLLDIATLYLGSADAAFDLAMLNGISITEELVSGQEIKLGSVVDAFVVEYLKTVDARPASGDDVSNPFILEGIGYDIIGSTFKVY